MAEEFEEIAGSDLADAVDEMRDSVAAFTYDGARAEHGHVSGAPEERTWCWATRTHAMPTWSRNPW